MGLRATFGVLWGPIGFYGAEGQFMGSYYGALWDSMGLRVNLWGPIGFYGAGGHLWGLMGPYGILWG